MFKEFIKFISVGFLMLVFSLASFYILLDYYELPLYSTYIFVYLFAIIISYYLNSKFTFKKKYKFDDAVKYYIIYLIGLIIGILLLKIFEGLLDVTNLMLVYIVLVPRTLFTFILTKVFIYK